MQAARLTEPLTCAAPGVGKTSLLVRFVDDVYSESYMSTIGCVAHLAHSVLFLLMQHRFQVQDRGGRRKAHQDADLGHCRTGAVCLAFMYVAHLFQVQGYCGSVFPRLALDSDGA